MHDRRREIEERLSRVVDERIQPAIYSKVADLTLEVWHVPLNADGTVGEPVPFEKARSQSYAPAQVGDRWGPAWGTSWFHVTGSVPAESSIRRSASTSAGRPGGRGCRPRPSSSRRTASTSRA